MENKFFKDGGYRSRKFVFSVICLVSVLVAGLVCPAAMMPEVVTGILGVCALYIGGNVANRIKGASVLAKEIAATTPEETKPAKQESVETTGD